MNILLTGASGFIGRALSLNLIEQGFNLTVAVRKKSGFFPHKVKQFVMDKGLETDFADVLSEIDVVIHLAGKAGRYLAKRDFSIEKVVDSHISIYRELLSGI